jgi:hypothetical protein
MMSPSAPSPVASHVDRPDRKRGWEAMRSRQSWPVGLFQVRLNNRRSQAGPHKPADLLVVAEVRAFGAEKQPDAADQWQQDRQQEKEERPDTGHPGSGDLFM